MSKHLRFGKLLSLLAIMLTMSFAWVQAQNSSSEKQLLTFGFTTTANPTAQLGSDVTGVINQTTHAVAVTVPYQTVVTGLKATFTSSKFSNAFGGVTTPTLPLAVSGVSPALDYTSAQTWTIEAENHSFENYVVTVTKAAASTAKNILNFTADNGKPWLGNCTANGATLVLGTGAFTGNNITFPAPYGTDLNAITVYYAVSDYATGLPATGAAVDFDTNNDGVADAVSFVITAQNGSTQNYSVLPVVGEPSYLDNLLSFAIPNANSVTIDHTTQTIAAVVPNSATAIAPTWTISPYAKMYGAIPPAVPPVVAPFANICSGDSYVLAGATTTISFWIQAEKPTEVSRYVLTVTKAAPSTANTLNSISATYTKANPCGAANTGTVVGTIGATTVTFNVPFGVANVTVSALDKSALSSSATVVGTVLTTGSTITILAEDGVTSKTYTVAVVASTISLNKQILTFGFHKTQNNPFAFPDWTVDYAGVITDTPTNKHIVVTVAWNTDLHDLIAYFTTSPYSCVSVAESNLTYTAQTSDVTVNDHSNTLTYVVTAEDGTQERYDVEVLKAAAKTENLITSFSITDLPYCALVSPSAYSVAGTITGNNITVMVPNRSTINLSSLKYAFAVSDGATASVALTGTLASPATITVTSQSGLVNTYTVTVTKYALTTNPASRKQLTKFWFAGSPTNSISGRVDGVINETAKTVEVWVPWGTTLTTLKAGFELNDGLGNYTGGVVMTHSEDPQVVQVSNTTANDYTTPVAYTVFAEDCSTVEYFVTVHMTPDVNTGISAFTFSYTPCTTGCALVNRIDAYARRIYITLPHSLDITSLAPATIVVAPAVNGLPAATVSPAAGVAQNWTNGPVKYTVTAPDGVTKADWMVYVTNPACTDHDILTFALPSAQVSSADLITKHGEPVVIDAVNHKIDVIIKKGVDKSRIAYTRTLSCGATICCVGGNCQDNQVLDFTTGCHTCVVTAEDETVKQDWTICVHEIDNTPPTVQTWSVMAYNCSDSVAVQTNEAGRVFIVNESILNKTVSPWVPSTYNLADWTNTSSTATSVAALIAKGLGNYATVSAAQVNTPVYVKTNALYSGTYWAFAVDDAGRISCISDQKLFLDICEKEIATLCDLRSQPDVWRYKLTEEVFVTYEEAHAGGNWKFVQDATCGIMIVDRLGALPVANYGEGAGVTNLIGLLDKSGVNLTFVPVCCYTPTKSSTGNVVAPVEVTWEQYAADCYATGGSKSYESMLVKITTPMIVTDGYYGRTVWPYDAANIYNETDMVVTNGKGGSEWGYIQSTFNSILVGKVIPTVPAYYTGIRNNVKWGSSIYGLFTPRKEADITLVSAPIITANPNPALIGGVVVGTCGTATINIYNEGVGNLNITALYLDDAAATDGFNLLTPPTVPFTLGTWTNTAVTVNFCPTVAGNKSTNLIIEYGVGKTLVVPINGTTMLIYPLPFSENFNAAEAPAAWNYSLLKFGSVGYSLLTPETNGFYYGHNWVTGHPSWLVTPGIDLRTATKPVVSFRYGTLYNSYMRMDVSTNYTTWTTIKDWGWYTLGNQVAATLSVDLSAYAGQVVYIRWYSASGNYFGIDDVTVQEQVTTPIMAITPATGAFGGVQVGATGTINFSIKNAGVSILNIKSVSVSGANFTLTDTNTYPIEVTDGPGTWAYTVGNTASEVTFSGNYSPTDIGVQTGKITVVYGLYADQVLEIPLTGEGLSCSTAVVATKGRNYAPGQNTWFKYTADKFSIVQITSCDEHQDLVTDEYAWDTYLYVYSDCAGTLLAENDDMEANCVYNRASSWATIVMNAGETAYIFWPLKFPTAAHAYEEFYWNINVTYPIDGDVCENAIPLTLPVVNHFGTTVGFNDDYDASPCSPYSNYMDGNDKVYTITLPYEGYLTGDLLGAYGSIHVLDICPTAELTKDHCKFFVSGPNGGSNRKKIAAGTYFVIISTWSPPQTVDYLLNMSFSGTGIDDSDLANTLSVYPNPTNGKFTVSISNSEATDMTIELVNISGQVVYRNDVKAAYSYNEDIDASSFAKGVYYLKVNDGTGVKVEKVVLQ